MAVPNHGSDRARHLLSAPRRAVVAVSLLVASAASFAQRDDAAATWLDALSSLALPMPGSLADAPTWPEDLANHGSVPFESRLWYAALVDGRGGVHALRQRIDAVRLVSSSTAADSVWRTRGVVRVDGAWRGADGAHRDWREIQRAAAGLASTGLEPSDGVARGMGSGPWRVHHDSESTPSAPCAGRWRVAFAIAALEARQHHCPAVGGGATLRVAETGALVASATVTLADGSTGLASGVAWQRHLWGDLPRPGGAVQLDRAVLTVAGIGTLELLRSRRSSGRGRAVVTGSVLRDGRRTPLGEIDWRTFSAPADADADRRDAAPTHRVEVPSLDIRLTLTGLSLTSPGVDDADGALALAATSDRSADPGWQGIAWVGGSHAGAGYIELGSGAS